MTRCPDVTCWSAARPVLELGELTHLTRTSVDADLALSQWPDDVDVFRASRWGVTEVEPADELSDGVLVEDTVVVLATSRRGRGRRRAAACAGRAAGAGRWWRCR